LYIDWGSLLFLVTMSLATYGFEVYFILPALGVPHFWPGVLGLFVLSNIFGNLLALMAVDTSCSADVIGVPDVMQAQKENWRLCYECGALAPPRAWHCDSCKTCVLKREHHCMFAGYCVGHRNHR
jgi:palmitoyltransferase